MPLRKCGEFYVIRVLPASSSKKRMQKMYFLLTLSVCMAIGGTVWGQDSVPNRSWKPVMPMVPWKPVMPVMPWKPLVPGEALVGGKLELLRAYWSPNRFVDSVPIMSPDRMPCRVPSMAGVERMPVKELHNRFPLDPMGNGVAPK
jgi:hypothetical protein